MHVIIDKMQNDIYLSWFTPKRLCILSVLLAAIIKCSSGIFYAIFSFRSDENSTIITLNYSTKLKPLKFIHRESHNLVEIMLPRKFSVCIFILRTRLCITLTGPCRVSTYITIHAYTNPRAGYCHYWYCGYNVRHAALLVFALNHTNNFYRFCGPTWLKKMPPFDSQIVHAVTNCFAYE